MSVQLVWFKRDLRVFDHEPLARAAKAGYCVGLYVYERELIEADHHDAAHLQFVNESLLELRDSLRRLGGELLLRVGQVTEEFEKLHKELGLSKIWAHEETFDDISYQRDRRVRRWVKDNQIAFEEIPQYGVVRRLKSRDRWSSIRAERMNRPLIETPKEIRWPPNNSSLAPGKIQNVETFKVQSFDRTDVQSGGESKALECLDSFLDNRGRNYRDEMSSPVTAGQSCSRLSPFIAYGNVSMRTIENRTSNRIKELGELKKGGAEVDPSWRKSLSSFKSRLSWHCHFMQKLEDEPTVEFQNMNRAYDGLRENEFNRDYFNAWCMGQTGFPMVDACMRALHQTGWINFRMRAMLVSFAAYHLWLHWREPAVYLARLFLDFEPGIHYSQVQMQSGVTGINTIRIYSPIKQVADQDPQGKFIRRYVPELADVPDKHLAEPHKMNLMEQSLFGCRIGRDFPFPIVDHKTQYKIARDRIFKHKRLPETRMAAQDVYTKHGSRKTPMSQR